MEINRLLSFICLVFSTFTMVHSIIDNESVLIHDQEIKVALKKTHTIKVVCTAALIDNNYEMRKQEYIHALKTLGSFGFTNPYIVEAIKKGGSTFLNEYSTNVFYSTMNNARLRNKGVNEARTMLEGLQYFKFNPDDMILKITGRYYFANDIFINTVKNNPDYDGFVSVTEFYRPHAMVACYALRYDLMKEMLESIDYAWMERDNVDLEYIVHLYVRKLIESGRAKIMFVPQLHVWANIYGEGRPFIAYI